MKKLLAYYFLFFLSSSFVNGQPVGFEWAVQLGGNVTDKGEGIIADESGNSYITGYFTGTGDFQPGTGNTILTSNGQEDIFLLKLSAGGSLLWVVQIGGIGREMVKGIALDDNNNIYITGSFEGTVDFDPGVATVSATANGRQDMFISKFSSTGTLIWNKHIVSTAQSVVETYSIAIDISGDVLTTGVLKGSADFNPAAGNSTLSSNSLEDFFILKLTTDGNYLWAHSFSNGDLTATGTCGRSITTDKNKNVYIGGNFSGKIDFNPGGNIDTLRSDGNSDAFLLKLSRNGEFVWVNKMGGIDNDILTSLVVTDSLNIYCTGYFSGTADFDPSSAIVSFTALGDEDVFIVKFNEQGLYLWAKKTGSQYGDQPLSLMVDPLANVYAGGYFSGNIDFDPGAGIASYASLGFKDAFILKLTASGNFAWAKTIGSIYNEQIQSIYVNNAGSVFSTGYFMGGPDFNPEAGTFTLSSINSSSDVFVQKLSQPISVGVEDPDGFASHLQLYPNPCQDQLQVSFDHVYNGIHMELTNVNGQVLEEINQVSGEHFTLDLSAYNPGIYYLHIRSEQLSTRQPICKL